LHYKTEDRKQPAVREANQDHQSTRDETLAINNATTTKMIAASKRKVILQNQVYCVLLTLYQTSEAANRLRKGKPCLLL